jgi:glucokinase
MQNPESAIRHFTISDHNEALQTKLNIFDAIKNNDGVTVEELASKAGVAQEFLTHLISAYQKKNLIEVTDTEGKKTVNLKGTERNFLGVGFDGENCYLALVDAAGKVTKREKVLIPTLKGFKGRIREFKEVIRELARGTRLRGSSLYAAGMTMSESLESKSERAIPMLAEGISHLFGCGVIFAKEATAAAYGEREYSDELKDKGILYMHTDSGNGVIIKGQSIFQKKGPGQGRESYLRPWWQFDAAKTAKDLVNKGLGTEIVTIVNGDIDSITIRDVLDAAQNKDELAEDLVRRSALAIGVRAAYLVNIFDVDHIVLGGGIDKKEGNFAQHVKESLGRFLLAEKTGKIRVMNGVLGEESFAIGAALLCRRELFMEG